MSNNVIDKYFPVLDYGFVALKSVMGDDYDIEEAARVSYGKGTRKTSDTRNLLRYLYRNKHTTPYEMVEFKFHCGMPIFVARQWIRHRTASVNEYSGRYSLMPELYYTAKREQLTTQSINNKQGRTDNLLSQDKYDELSQLTKDSCNQAFNIYHNMLGNDVARELARSHLPLSTYTYWYWKIDLHNLLHFLKLRCDKHAQWEIRVFATTMASIVKTVVPLAFQAWEDYSFYASVWTRLDKKLFRFIDKNYGLEDSTFEYITKNIKAYEDIKTHAKEIGMSDRELFEFIDKLVEPEEIDFNLDMSCAKDFTHFENLIKTHTNE